MARPNDPGAVRQRVPAVPVVLTSKGRAQKPPFQAPGKPFAGAQRQAARNVRTAGNRQPNDTQLKRLPILEPKDQTPAYRAAAINNYKRFVKVAVQRHGMRPDALSKARGELNASDRQQVDLATGVFAQHQHATALAKFTRTPAGKAFLAAHSYPANFKRHIPTVGLGPASISLAPLSRFVAANIAPSFANADPVLKHAFSDITGLPKAAAESLYEIPAAAVEAAQGRTGRAQRIVKSLGSGPIGQTIEHGPGAGLKALAAHPVLGALELSGAGAALGRVGGAVARSGALGGAAREGAAIGGRAGREIAPGQVVERGFSKNPAVKAVQRVADRRAAAKGFSSRAAQNARGRAVDEAAAAYQTAGRSERDLAARKIQSVIPTRDGKSVVVDRHAPTRVRPERDVVQLAVERRVRPGHFEEDLRNIYDRLSRVAQNEGRDMNPAERLANREQRKAINRVLMSPEALANEKGVFDAADRYIAHADPLEQNLIHTGSLDARQALESKLRPYAVEHMGARYNKASKQLVDQSERRITPEMVVADMKAHGVPMPGFVSHVQSTKARAMFVNWWGSRKSVDVAGKVRTGEATRQGTSGSGLEGLAQQFVKRQGALSGAHNFDRFVHDFGIKRADLKPAEEKGLALGSVHPGSRSGMFNWDEATKAAQELGHQHGIEYTPVRVVPARYSEAQRAKVEAGQDVHALGEVGGPVEKRLAEALRPPEKATKTRNVVLVPSDQLDRFREHQAQGSTSLGRAGHAATATFRSTVLPFSTKWVFGNVAEAALRLAVSQGDPASIVHNAHVGRKLVKVLRETDPETAARFESHTLGGLLFGGADRLAVHAGAERFKGGKLERPAQAVEAAGHVPGIQQSLTALRGYKRAVFGLNKAMEHGAQYATIGKLARTQIHELTGSWLKSVGASDAALRDVAKGLKGTPAQVRYARYLDETLGKYSRFSPSARRIFQSVAPFAPWYINAAKFVFKTLPVDHPVLQAVSNRVAQEFQADWDAQHKDVPPGDLKWALANGHGGFIQFARYTPMGAFSQGVGGLPDIVLPQASGALLNLRGLNVFGQQPKVPKGEKFNPGGAAVNTLIESMVPGVSIARRAMEGGRSPYDNSTILAPKTKTSTSRGGAVGKILNPLNPIYLKKKGTGFDFKSAGTGANVGSAPSGFDFKSAR